MGTPALGPLNRPRLAEPVPAKLDPGLPAGDAREHVLTLRAWHPLESDLELMESSWSKEDRWGLAFCNAFIVAAARRLDCDLLLTEDFPDGQDLEGLRVRSPFLHPPP